MEPEKSNDCVFGLLVAAEDLLCKPRFNMDPCGAT